MCVWKLPKWAHFDTKESTFCFSFWLLNRFFTPSSVAHQHSSGQFTLSQIWTMNLFPMLDSFPTHLIKKGVTAVGSQQCWELGASVCILSTQSIFTEIRERRSQNEEACTQVAAAQNKPAEQSVTKTSQGVHRLKWFMDHREHYRNQSGCCKSFWKSSLALNTLKG